jgi:HAMP domain-containing protein
VSALISAIATTKPGFSTVPIDGQMTLVDRSGAFTYPGGSVVTAISLAPVTETVAQLELIVTVGSAAVVILIGAGVFLVLRRGLRPIETMAAQADRITAGDLASRVTSHHPRSETGRLATALNGMLARIEASVLERKASQEQMRQFFADHPGRHPGAACQRPRDHDRRPGGRSRGHYHGPTGRPVAVRPRRRRPPPDRSRRRVDRPPGRLDTGSQPGPPSPDGRPFPGRVRRGRRRGQPNRLRKSNLASGERVSLRPARADARDMNDWASSRAVGRGDLPAPDLPGRGIEVVKGELFPVDIRSAYDGHRDPLKLRGDAGKRPREMPLRSQS